MHVRGLQVEAAVVLISRRDPEEIKKIEEDLKIRIFYAFKATKKEDLQREPLKKFIEKEREKKKKKGDFRIPLDRSISP